MHLFSFVPLALVATSLLAIVRAAPAPVTANDPYLGGLTFDYFHTKVRGVNLGGWFVLEPWITPSIFEQLASNPAVKDEYTYTQALGKAEAYRRLSQHWNSWITQDDFNQIARAGLNHVRIPIGYWAVAPLPGEPYVQGQLAVLDQAIGWARAAGLKVLLDLHGAPGSQNGFDNSGRLGPINWQQGNTVSQTLDAIKALASRYASASDVVTSIELLNEPLPAAGAAFLDTTKDFYKAGYSAIRAINTETVVVIHDAFQGVGAWQGFLSPPTAGVTHVMLDTHQYQIFDGGQIGLSPSQHVSAACGLSGQLSGTDKWTVVGEWTGAQTDCAKWLNGLGRGARYDGTLPGFPVTGSCAGKYTGTVAALSADDKSNLRHFIEAQLDAYESRTGWFFWTWKTESAPEWDMQDLLNNGIFPQPLTSRKYPGQCK